MAEYIDREAFAEDIRESYHKLQEIYETLRYERERDICNGELGTFCEILLRLKDFPTADVAPVVRGRWVKDGDFLICLNCESEINVKNSLGVKNRKNYCPNCGARMDGE